MKIAGFRAFRYSPPMHRSLLTFSLILLGFSAEASPQGTFAQWRYLRDPGTLQISFQEGHNFLRQHGDWPEIKTIRLRTEEAALRERPASTAMAEFCSKYPPISGRGMFACHMAGQKADIKQAWKQGDFAPSEEIMILSLYGDQLGAADHEARTARLLFEGKTSAAQRMLKFVSAERQKLYSARIALITGAKDANAKLAAVPAEFQHNPGLLFDRIRWRHARNMDAGVQELFLQSPQNPEYADLWWPIRAVAVREALAAAQYGTALDIISRHGDLKPEFLAEALWLKGWITLEYRHDSQSAYKDFYRLYNSVGTPVSKARAAYWAARAAKKNGNADIARDWLEKAAAHPTVFYGQLAHVELNGDEPLSLPQEPHVSDSARSSFAREPLIEVTRWLAQTGDQEMVDRFLMHLGAEADSPQRFALLAEFAQSINAAHGGVVIAKMALRKNVVLIDAGWPLMTLPANLDLEPGLTLAITRQESEFDPRAQSSANARGLMQLLPGTALQTAKKIGLPYQANAIWDETTNVTLGSAYLAQMIAATDDSYILGIASYNAGPRNARNWENDYGHPPKHAEGAVNWTENIPFAETRNYVQRVLENLQVYRARLNKGGAVRLREDLTR